jgi:ribosomal protein L7Ae-like RNA K-turn-binding protein
VSDGGELEQVKTFTRPSRAKSRALQLLGLANRAGKLLTGSDAVLSGFRSRHAKMVLMASDVGQNSRKKYRDKCAFYDIPLIECFTRHELGTACGRREIVVVALTDPGFATRMLEYVGELCGGEAFDETSGI